MFDKKSDPPSETPLLDTVNDPPVDPDAVAENVDDKGEPAPGNFA